MIAEQPWSLYGWTWFAAFCLYMILNAFGRQPLSLFRVLQIQLDGRPLVIFADMLITSLLLGILTTTFMKPCSPQDAVIGGLGSSGLFSSFGRAS